MSGPMNAVLVCGGRFHDMDYARLRLLEHLGESPEIRTLVAGDYSDVEAIRAADLLITYTCDVRPTEEQQKVLHEFVAGGGRWFALHGTNSVLEQIPDQFAFSCPRTYPLYMQTLGSQFLGHPPIQPFTVTISDGDHPLIQGIEPFEATDELYLCEYHGEITPLLETRYTGEAPGFQDHDFPNDEPRLVMYLHPVGKGEVLYLTLGHCRGKYDMRPLIDEYPQVERGAWELPVFHELIRRGLRWATRQEPA